MSFDPGPIGTPRPPFASFAVERAQIRRYAEAIGSHRAREVAGDEAPITFAMVAAADAIEHALDPVVAPAVQSLLRGVHAQHELTLHRPITPGMVLTTHATPVAIAPKRTGTVLQVDARTADASGAVVAEQVFTTFVRDVTADAVAGRYREVPEVAGTEPSERFEVMLADDVTLRYAAASGDYTAFHVDEAAARSAGLPGIIVHGVCTLATVIAAIAARAGSRAWRRVAVRFTGLVLPGERLEVGTSGAGAQAVAFTATGPRGPVLTRGYAEFDEERQGT